MVCIMRPDMQYAPWAGIVRDLYSGFKPEANGSATCDIIAFAFCVPARQTHHPD